VTDSVQTLRERVRFWHRRAESAEERLKRLDEILQFVDGELDDNPPPTNNRIDAEARRFVFRLLHEYRERHEAFTGSQPRYITIRAAYYTLLGPFYRNSFRSSTGITLLKGRG